MSNIVLRQTIMHCLINNTPESCARPPVDPVTIRNYIWLSFNDRLTLIFSTLASDKPYSCILYYIGKGEGLMHTLILSS